MKKIVMTLAAISLTAGLFAQMIPNRVPDNMPSDTQQKYFSGFVPLPDLRPNKTGKGDEGKITPNKVREAVNKAMEAQKVQAEEINKLNAFEQKNKVFETFKSRVNDNEPAVVTTQIKLMKSVVSVISDDAEQAAEVKENRIDVANRIETFHNQSLSMENPKDAFINSIVSDYKSNATLGQKWAYLNCLFLLNDYLQTSK